MKRYEYKIITDESYTSVEKKLNELGRDGWHVIHGMVHESRDVAFYTLERELSSSDEELGYVDDELG